MSRVIFSKIGKHRSSSLYGEQDHSKECSSDDDVFMEDLAGDGCAASKPLMHPRQRTRVKSRRPPCRCRLLLRPLCYFLLLVGSLGSLVAATLYIVSSYNGTGDAEDAPPPQQQASSSSIQNQEEYVVGCSEIEVEDVWVAALPKLLTESAFRLVDVNQDGVLDVILGFATGVDGFQIPKLVCDIYFSGTKPCQGGLLALEGLTGQELWRHFSQHEIYGINCKVDFNEDTVPDCLAGGRNGVFQAISGRDGRTLWNFGPQESKNDVMNLYTAQVIRDLDGDRVPDVLAIHGGDPLAKPGSVHRLSGRIILFSGKTGKVMQWQGVPDERESYYSPQVYTLKDGTEMVLFGTGGETHPGALWQVELVDLYKGNIQRAKRILGDDFKGVMTPAVLADLTGDGTEDIVIPLFNSTILAIDGESFDILWNYSFPMSESYNTPAPGYYNDDDTPDFLVKYAHGPGFPIYYYSMTTVLDGKTGQPLIEPYVKDIVGAQSSPLTVSMEGRGNDLFLYWVADCIGNGTYEEQYSFVKGTNVHEQSRADFCHLRFKSKGFSKLYVISQHIKPPGATIYFSEERKEIEHSAWINTTAEALEFVQHHPEYLEDYLYYSGIGASFSKQHNQNREFEDKIPFQYGQLQNRQSAIEAKKGTITSHLKSGRPEVLPRYQKPSDDSVDQYNSGYLGPSLTNVLPKADNKYNNAQYEDVYDTRYPIPEYPQDGTDYSLFPYSHKAGIGIPLYTDGQTPLQEDISNYRKHLVKGRHDLSNTRMKHKRRGQKKRSTNTGLDHGQSFIGPLVSGHEKHFLNNYKMKKVSGNLMKQALVNGREVKRHVGPHDEAGIQRLLSTGTLAPSTLSPSHPDFNHSIDIVFATYWFFPSKPQAILPEDQNCISEKLSKEIIRFQPKSKYYGMDHDAYEDAITKECLALSNHHQMPTDRIYQSQTRYNPYNVHMGQMTVYRLRIKCKCKTDVQETRKHCSQILPFGHQQWPSYMGAGANSHWLPRSDSRRGQSTDLK